MTINPDALLQSVRRTVAEGDLEGGLSEIYHSISGVTPITKINIIKFDYSRKLLRVVAQATARGSGKTGFMYDVPEKLMPDAGVQWPENLIVNQPETDPSPLLKEFGERSRILDWSTLFLNFKDEKRIYGSVMFWAPGRDQLTETHTRLLTSLRKPFQRVLDAIISEDEKNTCPSILKEPVKSKNEFFHQVTLRLCGHLDLQTGATRCLQYLSRFLPADVLLILKLEPGLQANRVMAQSEGILHQRSEPLIPWTPDALLPLDSRGRFSTFIINQPEHHPEFRPYIELYGLISGMTMPLIRENELFGIAGIGLEGRNRYNENHKALFSSLHDPFALALSNTIQYREAVQLKNLIEQEKKDLERALDINSEDAIIGGNLGSLKGVMENALLVSGQDSPVLLSGETGVGKELIANFIHRKSLRNNMPFIKVNCGAIPDTLVDSELFGHEKGAFTGAVKQKKGRFERADKGTIFLDEIGELPLQAQVRLLRVLQGKVIERVGGTDIVPVDVRIIAATHRNLDEMVVTGRFREDLWFRLNVFPILVPPLRSRKMDIPALVDYFVEQKSRELKLHDTPTLSPDAMRRLTAYDWPGNIRELKNVIERELLLNRGKTLAFHDIGLKQPDEIAPEEALTGNDVLGLDEVFVRHVKKVLRLANGKIEGPGGAAELLNIKSSTLRNRMKKLGIPYGRKKRV